MNDYYVYEHIRLDNNTCFYVGKGRGRRCYNKSRNPHHDRIVKKYGMKVKILQNNLSEEEAYKLEQETIQNYVFNLDYGIDIIGYNNKVDEPGHLTNCSFGGEGSLGSVHSETWKKQHSEQMKGENNPMHGINLWNTYNSEKKERIKKKLSSTFSGENNPMYGVSPSERMSEEQYKIWLSKTIDRLTSQIGIKNPNYQNKTLHNKIKDNPELRIKYYSRKGSQNGRSKAIEVYDTNNKLIKSFTYVKECCEWLQHDCGITQAINTIRGHINLSINNKCLYNNMKFKYK